MLKKKKCSNCLKKLNECLFRIGNTKCNKCIYILRKPYFTEYQKTDKYKKYIKEYQRKTRSRNKRKKKERIIKKSNINKTIITVFNPPLILELFMKI